MKTTKGKTLSIFKTLFRQHIGLGKDTLQSNEPNEEDIKHQGKHHAQ